MKNVCLLFVAILLARPVAAADGPRFEDVMRVVAAYVTDFEQRMRIDNISGGEGDVNPVVPRAVPRFWFPPRLRTVSSPPSHVSCDTNTQPPAATSRPK